MKAFANAGNDLIVLDRFSRRTEGTVEIFEHETIRKITMKNDLDGALVSAVETNHKPRLVIGDATEETKVFIAKARSEHAELDSVLREVVGTQSQVR